MYTTWPNKQQQQYDHVQPCHLPVLFMFEATLLHHVPTLHYQWAALYRDPFRAHGGSASLMADNRH